MKHYYLRHLGTGALLFLGHISKIQAKAYLAQWRRSFGDHYSLEVL